MAGAESGSSAVSFPFVPASPCSFEDCTLLTFSVALDGTFCFGPYSENIHCSIPTIRLFLLQDAKHVMLHYIY